MLKSCRRTRPPFAGVLTEAGKMSGVRARRGSLNLRFALGALSTSTLTVMKVSGVMRMLVVLAMIWS